MAQYHCAASIRLLLAVTVAGGGCVRRAPDGHEPPQGRPAALFEDVTEKAGIRFKHTNGASGKYYYIEFSPPGCAFIDYDNDGWLDILLIQSGSSDPPIPGLPNRDLPTDSDRRLIQTGVPNAAFNASKSTRRPHCELYRNNHDGTFTNVTPGSGLDRDLGYAQGVAVADYDNDGFDDVFITAYGGNHLLHNDYGHSGASPHTSPRARTFTPLFRDVTHTMGLDTPHSTGYATSAAFGDYDNDGRVDLYVCYYSPWTWSRELTCNGPRNTRDYCTPEVYAPDRHQLFHNEGARFRDVSAESGIASAKGRGLAVAFLDYDGDGRQDIYVANDMGDAFLWHNDGRGRFTDRALESGVARSEGARRMAGMGIAIADYDHSGLQSLFVTNFADLPNILFHNRGNGQFEDASADSGLGPAHGKLLSFGCEFLDYDLDGWPDLVTANGHVITQIDALSDGVTYAQPKQLLHNERSGTFRPVVDQDLLGPLAERTVSRGLAVGDFDNDGRPDILVTNQNAPPQLFRNRYSGTNHWVTFRLIGSASNRDALHARVEITTKGERQTATVRAGSSYLSHSDTRLIFGLGGYSRVDKVVVSWPSGAHTSLSNLAADRIFTVREGYGLVE